MKRKVYIAITGPRDEAGRAPFTMFWLDTDGPWHTEQGADGKPVGYRRAQCFRAVPEDYVALGAVVVDTEAGAERLGHAHPDMSEPICVLRCCCCDERTRGRQWRDRDTGYGICKPCVKWMRDAHAVDPKRGESDDSVRRLFGIEGVHWNVEE